MATEQQQVREAQLAKEERQEAKQAFGMVDNGRAMAAEAKKDRPTAYQGRYITTTYRDVRKYLNDYWYGKRTSQALRAINK
jgi:hypothetical protein